MSDFESAPTADNILSWLENGGFSCVLYLGQHRAYVVDEDDDYGWKSIPVVVARELLRDGKIAMWDDRDLDVAQQKYSSYRPAEWVAAWNMGQRPWYGTSQNQQILDEYRDAVAQRLLASW